MWPWPRARRDLPEVNYNEDTDEEEFEDGLNFNSPLQSPVRPLPSRAGSPELLAHPTLNDNVDEVLEDVNYKLADHAQVLEEVEEVTDLLLQTDTQLGAKPRRLSEDTEVIAFNFKVPADNGEVAADNMPPAVVPVNFDAEDKDDGDKAQDQARHIKIEFTPNDIKFWFSQLLFVQMLLWHIIRFCIS